MGLFGKLFGKNDKAIPLSKTEVRQPRIPTVKFDQSRVTAAVKTEIRLTLRDVPEIGTNKISAAYAAALQSVCAGRNLKVLHDTLVDLGLANQRASEIAMLVNNRATSLMERERQSSIGITEAIWLYSGAPCMTNTKAPTLESQKQNTDHLAANGKRYTIADGMLMNGQRVWPGHELGCKCISKSVIPGFS